MIHVELSTMHELLMIAPEHFEVSCIFNSILPSSFIDEVDILMPELVLCWFIVCLDAEGAHGDLWGEDGLSLVHQEERRFSGGPTGWSSVTPYCAQKLIDPLLAMLFQAIIGVSLETLVDLCIGSLNLTIALWVSNKRIADLDAKVFAIPLEGTAGKLGHISYDPVWDPEPAYDRIDELDSQLVVDLDNRGRFRSFSEFVDGDVEEMVPSDSPRE
jgi:hypothetical protein